MPHLFMDGIEVEVPEGTVLIFNPTSKSPDALHGMRDVQFRAGGVIFQTKTDVIKEMDKPRFAQFTFLKPTDDVEQYKSIIKYLQTPKTKRPLNSIQ